MTSASESELLCRVGPNAPMGRLMRQYWIPATLSSELRADGAPVRLMLLGEKLLAFRDTEGRVGVMDHRCPHRCASLAFGRNEKGGLRCVYHGWKFDVEGNCLEMPNVPPHYAFPEKVKARAFPTVERNGLVWTYMGPNAPPPLPCFEAVMLPRDQLNLSMVQRECNWLQALEGDIDSSHFGFLHVGSLKADDLDPADLGRFGLMNRQPEYHVADTEWGTMYAAHRPGSPGQTYWRFAHFMFPFWTVPPDGRLGTHIRARAWVPMDDEHTMFVHLSWKENSVGVRRLKDGTVIPGISGGDEYQPNGSGWRDRWRLKANASNDYLIDREAQKRGGGFSGIDGVHLQDQAITESMGPIVDHTFEHLAMSDVMISRTRRRLIQAARALSEAGVAPPGVERPEIFQAARAGDFLHPAGVDWLQAYSAKLHGAQNPTGVLKKAALRARSSTPTPPTPVATGLATDR